MKILKPGKVEQKKFTCEKCGCVFVADKEEVIIGREYYGDYIGPGVPSLRCPLCGIVEIRWCDGTPYPQQKLDMEKLNRLIKEWNWWRDGTCGFAEHLIDNGVTFREV